MLLDLATNTEASRWLASMTSRATRPSTAEETHAKGFQLELSTGLLGTRVEPQPSAGTMVR